MGLLRRQSTTTVGLDNKVLYSDFGTLYITIEQAACFVIVVISQVQLKIDLMSDFTCHEHILSTQDAQYSQREFRT